MEKARVSPIQFFKQVKQEALKVTWPARKEVLMTTLVVFIMAALAAVFFLAVDYAVSHSVRFVLDI